MNSSSIFKSVDRWLKKIEKDEKFIHVRVYYSMGTITSVSSNDERLEKIKTSYEQELSLIHPSRGRPEKASKTAMNWISKAKMPVEYIISLDSDDDVNEYRRIFVWNRIISDVVDERSLIVNNNTSVVEATNHAAKKATGDLLLYLSDDFDAPSNWANLIIEQFEGVTEPMLLKVDDCLQRFDAPVLTIPIMNRALYERLGYFWHPGYKSMFVDEDLYWTAKKLGALKFAPHLKFPHEHVSVGKADNDETYRRSAANWDQGKALFAKRKAAGFPL